MEKEMLKTEKAQIQLYGNHHQILNDAIDRIVVEIHNRRKSDRCAHKILLTGCGPQCGSTSVSINLGISFADAKWKTLIIDCDLHKIRELKKLNDKTEKGLSDILLEETVNDSRDFEEIIYPTNIDYLSYIPCGRRSLSPARLFCSGMMKQLLEYLNDRFDYIIFDFPSVAVVPDAQILFGDVDGIILIAAPEIVTKRQIRDAKHKIAPFRDKYYGMIINKIDMGLYKKYVKRYDYYFIDKKGNQKLDGRAARQYRKKRKAAKEEA